MPILVSKNEIFQAFSESLDLIDSRIYNHHNDVAYIALKIALALNLDLNDVREIVKASLVHDIGVFTAENRVKLANYDYEDITNHGEIGYQLLSVIPDFSKSALLVRYHHVDYERLITLTGYSMYSNLIFLADRIAVLNVKSIFILNQVEQIKDKILEDQKKKFNAEYVEAFLRLAKSEEFWLNLTTDRHKKIISDYLMPDTLIENIHKLFEVSKLFIMAIDFRSTYTASHSIGVSKVARAIGELLDYDSDSLDTLEVAGYFHDIGKLALSREVLDKKGSLNRAEILQIKSHSFYTMEILSKIKGFEEIKQIAASHHEKLNGVGYPFKKMEMTEKEMILCIADIFTALTEDRSYRKMLTFDTAKKILLREGSEGRLDANLIQIVGDHFEALFEINQMYQKAAMEQYAKLQETISEA